MAGVTSKSRFAFRFPLGVGNKSVVGGNDRSLHTFWEDRGCCGSREGNPLKFNSESLLTTIQEDPGEEPNHLHVLWGIGIGKGLGRRSFPRIETSKGTHHSLLVLRKVNPMMEINIERLLLGCRRYTRNRHTGGLLGALWGRQ